MKKDKTFKRINLNSQYSITRKLGIVNQFSSLASLEPESVLMCRIESDPNNPKPDNA